MPRPTGQPGEKAQWEAAALLLDAYGEDVGAVVLNLIKQTVTERDYDGVNLWIAIIAKIEALADDRPDRLL